MNRVSYSEAIKWKCIELKEKGWQNKDIMDELNIRNDTQIRTWMRWYKNGETYRFSQSVGKQYSYGKGVAELSEIEQLKLENKRQSAELEILKKYKALERKWYQKLSSKL